MSYSDVSTARQWADSAGVEFNTAELTVQDRIRFKLELARIYAQIAQAARAR